MNFHPKLVKIINGEAHVNAAGILIIAASALQIENAAFTKEARHRAQSTIDAMLSAARRGGFTQSEVLETLLSTDLDSERTVDLAIIAVDCIGGTEALTEVLARAGFFPSEGA